MICKQEFSDLKNIQLFIASNFKHGFKNAMERSSRTKQNQLEKLEAAKAA